MAGRDRITFALVLLVMVLSVIGRAYPWIAIPITLFAVFLLVWGRDSRRTEAFIGRLPGGAKLLETLEYLDFVLSPRDREYEQHIRTIIIGYDRDRQKFLRDLWRVRSSSGTPAEHLNRFVADGFIEYPKDGPGWIKPELREIVGRTLHEVSA
jgi:hypothetical protein